MRGDARPLGRAPAPAEPGARAGGGARGARRGDPRGERGRRVEDVGGRPVVRTARGAVRPEVLILAGNAYLGQAVPEIADRVMPFSTQIMATEPLGERGRALLPTDIASRTCATCSTTTGCPRTGGCSRGGGTVYGGTDPADIGAKLRPNLERVFPELRGVRIEHAWSGNCAISFSRVPQMGRLGSAPTSRRATAGTGWWAATSSGGSSPRRCTATASRFDVFASLPGSPSRAGGASPFPIPSSALGGMACATVSAS